MPDLQWNYSTWNVHHGWEAAGDEWSVAWGGARPQWYGTILPRVQRFLPASRVLEIAPGHGRWTQFLLPQCHEYFGVDLSDRCVAVCRHRFNSANRAQFIKNDGMSLAMIPDNFIDFVFSYDSLVHAEIDVVRSYIWQICQKLTPTGAAYLHHSNAASESSDPQEAVTGSRAMSVSAELVKQLIEDCGAKVLIQEEVTWIGKSRTDCMTTFANATAFSEQQYQLLCNDEFLREAQLVKRYQSPYSSL
jgi:SAM-dependent methyltransferase